MKGVVRQMPVRLTSQPEFNDVMNLSISETTVHKYYQLHRHEFYEMELVLSGSGKQIVNGISHNLSVGSLYLLTPYDFHEIMVDEDNVLKIVNIKFLQGMISSEVLNYLTLNNTFLNICLAGNDISTIMDELKRMKEECASTKIFKQHILKGILERILIDIIRSCNCRFAVKVEESPVSQHAFFQNKVLSYIHHHFREQIALEDVAASVHLTPNYFSEYFHKVTGKPFQSYLQGLRLNFSVSLLTSSTMPVTEICLEAGFNSLSHFIRSFKNTFGMSPNAYRKTFVAVIPNCR